MIDLILDFIGSVIYFVSTGDIKIKQSKYPGGDD